jgi:AAA15 family ATPase/GTPase
MLIQFRVANHRSLRDEQILSLVAADALGAGDTRCIHAPGIAETLLPALALYGANASGKSNVIGALRFMRDAVIDSQRRWEPDGGTPQDAFALAEKSNESSLYEIDFLRSGIRYRYGFALNAEIIEEEWLYAFPKGTSQTLFERNGDKFDFGSDFIGENDSIAALTRSNSLFLSAAAQNNHKLLMPLYAWFRDIRFEMARGMPQNVRTSRVAFGRVSPARRLSSFLDPDIETDVQQVRREAILRLLRSADIGIIDIKVSEEDVVFESGRQQSLKRTELYFMHRSESPSQEAWLPLSAQSAGTVRLLEMAVPLLRVIEEGGLLCVDELESSLHPKLALEILRLFQDPRHNPCGAQLIFSTHDTNLLGNVLGDAPLRRDQVWFTEKDQFGATHLYPLTDFYPKNEENLERGYLQGRYGAIPFLGDLVAGKGAT